MGQKKGNQTPTYQDAAYIVKYPNTNARENRDMGSKPVMIDDTTTLDQVIDIAGMTSGYAKDTDLTDGTINARFDTLTANEYHVTILSSSVMYANGSNKLGDSADDRHEFTGSIQIGGGELSIRLNQATQSLQVHSASVDMQLVALTAYTGSSSASLHDGSKNVSFNTVTAASNGAGQNFKVGDDVWLGDRNVSNTMVISGIQEPTSAILQFGSGSQPSIAHLVAGAAFPAVGSALAITGSLLIGHTGHLYFFNGGVSNGGWAQII
jgi:hypothetical protein